MSIDKQIETLERLAAVDAIIKELTEGRNKWQGELDGVRTELEAVEASIKADEERIAEMEKTRGECIQEMRNVSGQIDRSRDRMQRARNEREVNAAERELDELRKISRDRDHESKKLSELSSLARESTIESEKRREELQAKLDGSLEGTLSTIGELEAELSKHNAERAEIEKLLPNMMMRRYQRHHQRGKVAIAKTFDGTCQGCFVSLPPMMFHNMLARTKFEECPQCHRIMYYAPKPTEEEEAPVDVKSADADAPVAEETAS